MQSDIVLADGDGAHAVDVGARLDRDAGGGDSYPTAGSSSTATDGTQRGCRAAPRRNDRAPVGDVHPNGVSIARDATIASRGASASDPSEIYVLRPGAPRPERLTSTNAWLASRGIGTKRTIAWRAADGTPLDAGSPTAEISKGKKYPLVLVIHGGPTGSTRATFSSLAALMAGRGWLVLEPNYRGSDNHGAKSIATSWAIRCVAGRDILDVVALVEKEGSVDTTRIGVSGWSAGGMMTSWLIRAYALARSARRRACHVAARRRDDERRRRVAPALLRGEPMGRPDGHGAHARGIAADVCRPREDADADRHRAGDQRVPTPLSYEFYHAVRATGTPAELLVYPVDGHFPGDPLHAEDVNRRWIDWFAKHF